MEVVEAVGSPAVGLLLDIFHMNIEEKSFSQAIRTAGASLFHFHACGSDRGAPGGDHIDWGPISEALREVDYRGHLCIESFTTENEAIATATSIWRPLANSQDEIATRGLDFLRGLPASSKNKVGTGVHERD
jgi:D-psicose/D-tagatose/L-ribulose 3-epimerase